MQGGVGSVVARSSESQTQTYPCLQIQHSHLCSATACQKVSIMSGNASSHTVYRRSKLRYLLSNLFAHFFFRSFRMILYPFWNVENGLVAQCFHFPFTTQTLVEFVSNSQFCQLLSHVRIARRGPNESSNLLKKLDIVQCPRFGIHRDQCGLYIWAWSYFICTSRVGLSGSAELADWSSPVWVIYFCLRMSNLRKILCMVTCQCQKCSYSSCAVSWCFEPSQPLRVTSGPNSCEASRWEQQIIKSNQQSFVCFLKQVKCRFHWDEWKLWDWQSYSYFQNETAWADFSPLSFDN